MNDAAVLKDIANRLPGVRDPKKRNIFFGLMVVGVVAFAYLMITNPLRAWGAWAVNTLYFLGIAAGQSRRPEEALQWFSRAAQRAGVNGDRVVGVAHGRRAGDRSVTENRLLFN